MWHNKWDTPKPWDYDPWFDRLWYGDHRLEIDITPNLSGLYQQQLPESVLKHRRLALAVIRQAQTDIIVGAETPKGEIKRRAQNAATWLYSEATEEGSFLWYFDHLNVNANPEMFRRECRGRAVEAVKRGNHKRAQERERIQQHHAQANLEYARDELIVVHHAEKLLPTQQQHLDQHSSFVEPSQQIPPILHEKVASVKEPRSLNLRTFWIVFAGGPQDRWQRQVTSTLPKNENDRIGLYRFREWQEDGSCLFVYVPDTMPTKKVQTWAVGNQTNLPMPDMAGITRGYILFTGGPLKGKRTAIPDIDTWQDMVDRVLLHSHQYLVSHTETHAVVLFIYLQVKEAYS